jgi:hypothetical protein
MVTKIKAFSNMSGQQGMDLRDYFAAKAMQGLMVTDMRNWPVGLDVSLSKAAYELADAMMKARNENS